MKLSRALPALVLSLLPATIFAAPPDAGQLLREQQPQRQLPQQLPKPESEPERAPLADTGIRIQINEFRFSGYQGLATETELQTQVSGAIGKNLSFAELQALADKITAYLKDKGWFLARAYLPRQDITTGVIEIAIIQGKSDGAPLIRRDKTVRIREVSLQRIAEQGIRPGQPFNERELERAVLLMNDLPGITARASLTPGASTGSSQVQLDVSEGGYFNGAVWGDNQGNRYTGSWRGNATLALNDPFRYGDQFSFLVTGAEGLTQGRIGYTFPLTPSGLKGNLAYTGMGYDLVGPLASLDTSGQSHSIDAGVSYPILRSRTANVTTAIGYSFKMLTDSTAGTDIRDKQLHSGVITFSGDRYDTHLGGGYTSWNAGVTIGSLDEKVADIAITKTQGTYSRFNLGVSRLQRLAERLSLNLSYSGQFSLDNLDSSEKLNLGGPSGVRAYPIGEASGDEGHLLNLDLRYDLPLPATIGSLQLAGFYDAGQITLHHDLWPNAVATATNENSYWLQGAGLGLAYGYGNRFSIKTSWAHVIGDNPGRSFTGKDSDGRNDENRFWFQGTVYF